MRRRFFFRVKATTAAVLASCVLAGGFCAASAPGAAQSEQRILVSVDRTKKGDRLRGYAAPADTSTAKRKRPLGCDPAFSPVVDPQYAHVFGRCIS